MYSRSQARLKLDYFSTCNIYKLSYYTFKLGMYAWYYMLMLVLITLNLTLTLKTFVRLVQLVLVSRCGECRYFRSKTFVDVRDKMGLFWLKRFRSNQMPISKPPTVLQYAFCFSFSLLPFFCFWPSLLPTFQKFLKAFFSSRDRLFCIGLVFQLLVFSGCEMIKWSVVSVATIPACPSFIAIVHKAKGNTESTINFQIVFNVLLFVYLVFTYN